MSVNIRQTAFILGMVDQADLATANLIAEFFRPTKINRQSANLDLLTESNAEDIGKDDEFATQVFKTGWDANFQLESYLTSEMAAWAIAFGLGNSSDTTPATGAYRHTGVFQSASIDLPAFSYAEKQPSSGSYDDFLLIGNVVNGVTFQLNSGIGRQNAKVIVDVVGTGKHTIPSGLSFPAPTVQHGLNAGSASITINGTNYTSNKTITSMEFGWRNNVRLDSGYFPGSGEQNGANLRGRMEHGDREAFLRFTARLRSGSDELTKLTNQSEGTAVITLRGDLITGSTYHDLSVTFERVTFASRRKGEADGIVTVEVDCGVLKHASNGVVTAYATNEIQFFGIES